MSNSNSAQTFDESEIRHFAMDSAHWWDENGPFKPLHRANPARMTYIKEQICDNFGLDIEKARPLQGLEILDIGCGGGLVCESLSRLGAKVTGIDADENAIKAAKEHADISALEIDYRCMDPIDLDKKFDVVVSLEVIEHVPDIGAFVKMAAGKIKPQGLLIFSTLNRTAKSYVLAIIGLEHVLRWVPKGTHHWKKFVKPSELASYARQNSLSCVDIRGLIYNPLKDEFKLSDKDIDVNYFMSLVPEYI